MDKSNEECILIIHRKKKNSAVTSSDHWVISAGWGTELFFFFFFFPCSCFLCSLQTLSAKELTWHHAVKQGSTMHAFLYLSIRGIPKNRKAHLPTWISCYLVLFGGIHSSLYLPMLLWEIASLFLRPWVCNRICWQILGTVISVASHRHQVPNINIPLQAHVP